MCNVGNCPWSGSQRSTCPFCVGSEYQRVRFPRSDGTYYLAAEIYQCKSCTVMFGDKDVFMKLKDAIVRKGQAG